MKPPFKYIKAAGYGSFLPGLKFGANHPYMVKIWRTWYRQYMERKRR